MRPLLFGNVPVPWTVAWSEERAHEFLAPCPWFHREALCMDVAQGGGKPLFGTPHSQRQRQAIAQCLCDLCGKSLRASTKVSLSHARVVAHGAQGPCVMQVEPLLHRACAALSVHHCPSLKRDIRNGTLRVRQVTSFRAQCAIMDTVAVEAATGVQGRTALGHGKFELRSWHDRDEAWLAAALPGNAK